MILVTDNDHKTNFISYICVNYIGFFKTGKELIYTGNIIRFSIRINKRKKI